MRDLVRAPFILAPFPDWETTLRIAAWSTWIAIGLFGGAALHSAQRITSSQAPSWSQWAQNAQHTGASSVAGQTIDQQLSDIVFDPFVTQETAETSGALTMHYQAPLVNGNLVFMEVKSGWYNSCNPPGSGQPFPCGPNNWNTEIWNETAFTRANKQLVQSWNFQTDWVPVPNDYALGGWEPVFQPALSSTSIYVPGSAGTVYKLNQSNGSLLAQINPFSTLDPSRFVWGPLTADGAGNIYYNVVQVDTTAPWSSDIVGSWLVKVAADGSTRTVSYTTLVPNAPTKCLGYFSSSQLPFPPAPNAKPASITCGSQRAALNLAPTLSNNGNTIYLVSRAHFAPRAGYLVAVNSNLALKWARSLQKLLNDGCNVLLPPNGTPGGCRSGATTGVDPTQNTRGSAIISDQASASPVVTPDGSILLGVNTAYNYGRGHLLKFNQSGKFKGSYDFGWDTTPSVFPHDGTYSIVLKDNHYDMGSYCSNATWCPPAPPGPYYITQLNSDLTVGWQFADPTIDPNHPNGYEWCVNALALDKNGAIFGNSEDGKLYAIQPSGTAFQSLFLKQVLDAGYTPLSIGSDGTIYTLNDGHILAVGAQ
jgi:hypothetical protein